MKKILAMALTLTLGATVLAGCGSSDTDTTEATTAPETTTTFTVGFDQEFPPYGYIDDNGDFTGFDIEAAEEVAARNGWEIVLMPIDWDSKDFELESGTIDCIWNGFTMTGREDDYEWTSPYMDNSQVFVTRADDAIATKEDLAGKTVAVQADSSALAALEEEENAELAASFGELIEVADYNSAFMDLESGAIDAIGMDIGVAYYQISGREDEFSIMEDRLSTEQYAVGFKKGNTELRDAVENTMIEMVEDGTYEEIASHYEDYNLWTSFILGQ